jgi:hypothetical protein
MAVLCVTPALMNCQKRLDLFYVFQGGAQDHYRRHRSPHDKAAKAGIGMEI